MSVARIAKAPRKSVVTVAGWPGRYLVDARALVPLETDTAIARRRKVRS